MSARLEGTVAIVTGGANGIGAAYCVGLAAERASVWIADVDADAAERRARDLRAGGYDVRAIAVDVSDEECVVRLVREIMATTGRIDVLVNNASLLPRGDQRIATENLSVAEWDLMMAVNLRGMFLCTREVIAPMREGGGGSIINVSSAAWYAGSPTRVHYITTKAGVVGFTRSLAKELGRWNIRVNAIAPGGTMSEVDPSEGVVEQRQRAASTRALGRIERPDDLVGTLLFLAGQESAFITGQTIVVDGGNVML